MKRTTLLVAPVAIALLGVLALLLLERDSSPAGGQDPGASRATGSPAASATGRPSQRATPPPAEPRSTLADELNLPTTDIRSDLQVVTVLLDSFRSNFPRDGNPVGTNAEITAALTGHNRRQLAFIPADHPAINPRGELCDRWGTPFFFHAESGTRMEIRSAGPDRRLHTDDDVVLEP